MAMLLALAGVAAGLAGKVAWDELPALFGFGAQWNVDAWNGQ